MNPFFFRKYLSRVRFISFWHQVDEVLATNPKTVLEIGKGSGIVAEILKGYGIRVKTIDIDAGLKPDYAGDIRTFKFREKFDTVLCAEVLEHMPFENFSLVLSKINKITKKNLVLSLPEAILTYFHFAFKGIPFIPEINKTVKIYDRNKFVKPDHYWEIGTKATPLKLVEETISKCFVVNKNYQLKEIYHRFFLLTAK